MAYSKSVDKRAKSRLMRIRSRLKHNAVRPRVVVFRSLRHIYAQVIDHTNGSVLASCSSLEMETAGDKKAIAHTIGRELAQRIVQKGVSAATFDRGQYLYHGRVRALAQGLRDGGLTI